MRMKLPLSMKIVVSCALVSGPVRASLGPGAAPTRAENITFPADAGIVDLSQPPYNAVGDGVTDNTAILQRAITDHVRKIRVLYLPNGTYLVKDKLTWVPDGRTSKHLVMQGQEPRRNGD